MHGDLDDTRLSVPRILEQPATATDHDDTVVRGSIPAATHAAPPPALIEPPLPEVRPLASVDAVVSAPAVELIAPSVPAYVVRLADGRELPIDGPVYLGRKPSAPRIHTGPPPRLVTFPSPSRELSATHLELRIVGGSLVASDMRSTNGTVVRLPRSAPRALLRGESIVVVPGTRIDLGDGAVLDVLDPVIATVAGEAEAS